MSMAISRAKYTGDPGLFGDIFGGIKGAIGGAFRGFTGFQAPMPPMPRIPQAGPGMFGSAPRGTLAKHATKAQIAVEGSAAWSCWNHGKRCNDPIASPAPGPLAAIQRFLPGGATGMMPAPAMAMNGTAGGYHMNKSDYFLKSGEYVPAGTRWVKNRKRNPANARATSRAISRISGAKNYAKSLGRISIRKKC